MGPKYYMPTSMDLGVSVFWRWMSNMAGPVPWPDRGIPAIWSQQQSQEELLDRYNHHTKHCKQCSKVGYMVIHLFGLFPIQTLMTWNNIEATHAAAASW